MKTTTALTALTAVFLGFSVMDSTWADSVYISGEVNLPDRYEWKADMTLSDVVELAGGLTSFAKSKEIRILAQEANPRTVNFNVEKEGRGRNVKLKPADVIVVPKSRFKQRPVDGVSGSANSKEPWYGGSVKLSVVVTGAVKRGGVVPWKKGMRLTEALNLAGGVNESATLEKVKITRWNGASELVDYRHAIESSGRDPKISRGDLIVVFDREPD